MQPINIDAYGMLSSPGDVEFSPDGKQIAYMYNGKPYLVAACGERDPVELTIAGSGYKKVRLVWSSDGKNLHLLWKEKIGTWEIWTVPADNSKAADRRTKTSTEVGSLNISPDETHWLFAAAGTPVVKPPEPIKNADALPVVIDAMVFKKDGKGYLTTDPMDCIYAWDVKGLVARQLSDAPGHDTQPAWSPDGSKVAFIREDLSKAIYDSRVCVTPVKKSKVRAPKVLTTSPAVRKSPCWSPDGKEIAYLWQDADLGPYAVVHLAVYSFETGSETVISKKLNRTVTAFQYSADGRFIYFLYEHEAGRHLGRIRLSNNRINKLITGEKYVSSFDVNKEGHVAVTMNKMNDAIDVYVLQDDEPRQLSFLHADFFKDKLLGTKEQMFYSTKRGVRIQSLITKPADFDPTKKYPAVLRIHGGPVSQAVFGYDFFAQYLAAKGYVVVEPNPPGSTGRGQGFIKAVKKDWGFSAKPDVLGAIDQVVSLGYVDPDNLAVIGYSYGGYLTNCLITVVPKKFKAAVSGAGHSLIAANYGHDAWVKWYKWGLGKPWVAKDRKRYEKLSPFNNAGKVETPTLFLCGAQDWNVPLLNSELFYQALKMRGVPTQLVVYPKAAHTAHWYAGGYDSGKDYFERVVGWLNKFM